MGLPLNVFARQSWAQHVALYAEQSWRRWQRNLTQYGETFTWQTTAFGAMAAWPLVEIGLPQLARFTLEAELAAGRSRSPRMEAQALGFIAALGETDTKSGAVALHYAVTPGWVVGLRYAIQRSNFAVSTGVAALQYPGGSNSAQTLAASLGHHF